MIALLSSRSFQVFLFALAALGAICALLAAGVIDKAYGQSAIGLLIGFGLGVPVNTSEPAPLVSLPAAGTTPAAPSGPAAGSLP